VLRFHLLTDELAAAAWHGMDGGGGGTAWASAAGGKREADAAADAAADKFPLVLSPREQDLTVQCLREDLLVLGRGGTGKTTVMVHAMAAAAEEDGDDARVLFLTVNRNLCLSVLRQLVSLRRGAELANPVAAAAAAAAGAAVLQAAGGGGGGGDSRGLEDGGVAPAPAALCDAADAAWWPLSMPSRTWLLKLDASLLDPFLRREPPAAPGGSPRIVHADVSFVAALLGTSGATALDASPAAAAVAADHDDPSGPARRKVGGRKAAAAGGGGGGGRGRVFAGFEFWEAVYDKRAARSTWKGMGVGALWTEFCTHVKGSRSALAKDTGHLTREEYLALPDRATAVPLRHRPATYDAFEVYEKARRDAGASDLCDFVQHLHRRVVAGQMRGGGGGPAGVGSRPTHTFIDEVQDFTPAELELVLAYAGNARVTAAGDTAQTITRGTTSFKFAAVSAAFYLAGRTAPVETLTTNWRTHGGVQAMCSAVVRVMCRRFPGAVDKLPEERAHFAGPPPTCLPVDHLDAAAAVLFVAEGSVMDPKTIYLTELGAHQCVIVRRPASRAALPAEFVSGLCFTVEEAKGLEFADVVAVNFFTDSVATPRQWEAVLRGWERAGGDDDAGDSGEQQQEREQDQVSAVMLEELKMLYVLCTRAKRRLIFVEADPSARAAFFDAAQRAKLSFARLPPGGARFAKASSAEEWRARGASLLSTQKNYDAAATCFRNAGDVAGWLSATAEAARARAVAAGPAAAAATERDADLDGAARCYLMHAAAAAAPAHGAGGGGGEGGSGSTAEVCGALVKAAYCLHRLKRHAAAAAALELVGCRTAAAACHLHAAAATNANDDDDAEEGAAETAGAALAAAATVLRGNGNGNVARAAQLFAAAAVGGRRAREVARAALSDKRGDIDWAEAQRVARLAAAR